MLKLPECTRVLIKEAKELFPGEGIGFNWDTWNSIEEYEHWLLKKVTDEKKRREDKDYRS